METVRIHAHSAQKQFQEEKHMDSTTGKTIMIPEEMLQERGWLAQLYSFPGSKQIAGTAAWTAQAVSVTLVSGKPITLNPATLHDRLPNLRTIDLYDTDSTGPVRIRVFCSEHTLRRRDFQPILVRLHLKNACELVTRTCTDMAYAGMFPLILDCSRMQAGSGITIASKVLLFHALMNGKNRDQYENPGIYDALVKQAGSVRKAMMLAAIRWHNESIVDILADCKGTRTETWEAWLDAAQKEHNVIIRARLLDAMARAVDLDALREQKDARDLQCILNPFTLASMKKDLRISRIGKEGYRVSGRGNPVDHLMLPESIDGVPVVEIGEKAFKSPPNQARHFSAVMLGAVRRVQKEAFVSCEMEQLDLGTSLYRIGENAFQSVKLVKPKVHLPDTVKAIGAFAFYDAQAVFDNIPEGILTIGCSAFCSWNRPNSIQEDIWCPHLEYIGAHAFERVDGIRNIQIGSAHLEEGCFRQSTVETAYMESRIISSACFQDCNLLKKLYLPKAEIIERYALKDCLSLKVVEFGEHLQAVESWAFANVPSTCVFRVPDGYEEHCRQLLIDAGVKDPVIESK